jgi:hypothetical protein
MALVAVLALAVSACQVRTQVSVDATSGGRGTVRVTVTFDKAAVAALGGSSALAAQLQDTDLVAAGWVVTGPRSGPGSSTVVSASHSYRDPPEASALVAEVAGSGPAGSRPFQVLLSDRHSFWTTETILRGTVDLKCGLACFGDAGLTKALGSPIGVNPAPLASAAGQQPDQVFTFSVTADLPGSVGATNATARHGSTVEWTPQLGQVLELTATARAWNRGRVVVVVVAAVVVVAGLLSVGARWSRRRRRGRRGGRGRPRYRTS